MPVPVSYFRRETDGNILLDPMPDFLLVDGEQIPIDSGFRTWIQFDEELFWSREPIEKRVYAALEICYGGRIPADIPGAVRAAMEFYANDHDILEEPQEKTETAPGRFARGSRGYSFAYDAPLICAAFRAQYGIDLTKDELHWWHFKALFEGLSEDNKICRIMEIRGMDLSRIKDKEQKAKYRRLKRLYRLPDPRSEEEQEADMIDALAIMF